MGGEANEEGEDDADIPHLLCQDWLTCRMSHHLGGNFSEFMFKVKTSPRFQFSFTLTQNMQIMLNILIMLERKKFFW